ncbi:MAG TPA: glycosyltransferase [Vicinamibacterales bacterium]|jgi:glycosyltransferase involved in cell wall biosynthesis
MPRLLVLNNYPLDLLWEDVKRGETPDHLLFGINFLADAGWKLTFPPAGDRGLGRVLNALLRRTKFPIPLGDLGQQHHAWKALNHCDVIYAASQTQAHMLSYLRAVGFVSPRIVCLAHHPLNRGRLTPLRSPFLRWQLEGTDYFPALSRRVCAQINAVAPGKSDVMAWGPDANFYPRAPADVGRGLLAVGRTGRDFVTFGRGVSDSGAPAKIICLKKDLSPDFQTFRANVEVLVQPDQNWMPYADLIRHYASARALGIPLSNQVSLAGLSSLADALGMGKAVFMTRHPLVDLDIENLGIGRWIEPEDANGWRNAANWVEDYPYEVQAMGHRARQLVEHGLNSETFARRLLAILERAGSSSATIR